jgi:UDP-2,3-diacylglucosamine pyrophosphatase LpxH
MWILSDLHLSARLSLIDKGEVIRILGSISEHLPSQVVFNGDTFDFARTRDIPSDYSPTSFERKYGMSSSLENSIRRMQLIIENNPEIFEILKMMIEKGFVLVFIYGNHDSELRYPKVQKILSDRIGGIVGENLLFSHRVIDRNIWIEHGHQYDEENVMDYSGDSYVPEEYTFGYISTKYFGNIVESERRLPRNDASAGEYFIWVFKNFGLKSIRFIIQYFIYSFIVLSRSGIFFPFKEKANKIPYLYEYPIMVSFVRTIKRLYLIQVLMFLFFLFAIFITILIKSEMVYLPMMGLVVSMLPLFKINNRNRLHSKFGLVSHRLKEIYNVRFVVFGHNHYSTTEGAEYYSSVPSNTENGISILKVVDGRLEYVSL